jgi:hypothetical protein
LEKSESKSDCCEATQREIEKESKEKVRKSAASAVSKNVRLRR